MDRFRRVRVCVAIAVCLGVSGVTVAWSWSSTASILDDALAVMRPQEGVVDSAEPLRLDRPQWPGNPVAEVPEESLADWLTIPLFVAVADGDTEKARLLLAKGADVNGALPVPPPEEITTRFSSGRLGYYVRREEGFTPLMLAAALGDAAMVGVLLEAGADRSLTTRRHRTFALYLAAVEGHLDAMRLLMGIGPGHPAMRYRVRVDLAAQRASIFEDGTEILSSAISSGKKSKPTPPGAYLITNKYRKWTSTIYDVAMPYFMRFSCGEIGFHAGRVPGYPASSGCVRLPDRMAQQFFATLPIGTLVEIE